MKKIKILLLGMSSNLGGIETYLYNLVKQSDKTKFQFDFLFDNKNTMAFEKELKELGCYIYKITPRYINRNKHIKEIKEIFKHNYDYIHYSVMSYSWFEPIILASHTNSKIIIHSHNAGFGRNVSLKTKILHEIGRFKIRNIKYLKVACGREAGKFMFKSDNFTIFNNGIDLNKFKFEQKYRETIRKQVNINDTTTIIGIVAKLEKQKNILFLIDIFNEYQKMNNNSKLLIVGEGSLKAKIEKKINKKKIKDKVIFLGKREDTNKIYSAFDIYIMPSLYEGLSIALIEAQSNGLKCYTSDRVDKDSNITGNVAFLSLEENAKFWAKYIFDANNTRDEDSIKKIENKYDSKICYDNVYKYYMKNVR